MAEPKTAGCGEGRVVCLLQARLGGEPRSPETQAHALVEQRDGHVVVFVDTGGDFNPGILVSMRVVSFRGSEEMSSNIRCSPLLALGEVRLPRRSWIAGMSGLEEVLQDLVLQSALLGSGFQEPDRSLDG